MEDAELMRKGQVRIRTRRTTGKGTERKDEEVGSRRGRQVSSIMIAGRFANYVSLSERRWD